MKPCRSKASGTLDIQIPLGRAKVDLCYGGLESSGEQAELMEDWELGKILPSSEIPKFAH